MRFLRSLTVMSLSAAVLGITVPARAQVNSDGASTFPDLRRLQSDLQRPQTSAPPSQGPFGEQSTLPTPKDHPVAPPDAPSPWLITPQIQISETVTDNAGLTHDNRQADLQSFINPSIAVQGDTQLAKVDFSYSPVILRNVATTNGNRVDQNLFGTGTFTAVPDALFLNTRGSVFEGSRGGGMGPVNPVNLRFGDRTEVLAYDAGPEWRFPLPAMSGATGDLRYSIGQTRFYNNTGVITTNGTTVAAPISDATLQDLRLFLDSGDRGTLISAQFTADGTRQRISDGGGTNDTGVLMVEGQLRLSPTFQLLGSVGYEDLRYSNFSYANQHEPTWYGGIRWQNAQDSLFQVTYGHRQGADSFAGEARIPITTLTSAFATYGESITTPQQQIISNLNSSQLNANHNVVDPSTGLPQSLLVNEIALQNTIYRDRSFRAGIITTNEPNIYTFDVKYEDYVPIAGAAAADNYIGAEARWDHALDETTTFSMTGGYYIRQVLHENTVMMLASVSRLMTPTLIGSIGYEIDYGASQQGQRSFYKNAITAYLRKTF
jgi:uncharacterized protein (PEP-CTERM system associated)